MIEDIIKIVKSAGREILDVYNNENLNISYKEDKSPLTEADKRAHQIIKEGLSKISNYPILSEEGREIPYKERKNWEYFWLVDPLDGTKEFIKRNGEFTVNVALIHKNKPILGVVYAPAIDVLYYGQQGEGSYKVEGREKRKLPMVNEIDKGNISVVASKSHLNEKTKNFIKDLEKVFSNINTVSIGSSLKICLLAEGKADIYPRIAPTMEWDTAAAHSILNAVGGKIVQYSDNTPITLLNNLPEITYNKENLLNPYFVAFRKDVL